MPRPRRALVIRHTTSEGIAGFRAAIEAAGFAIDRIEAAGPEFASVDFDDYDLVATMGGPMGVYERAKHRWIDREIDGLARRIGQDRPTLGVCLGAQLVAAAMGARVWAGQVKEVGFAPLSLTAQGARSPLRHLAGVPVLHWHGDTFDLPAGATLLASSVAYRQQAFSAGEILAIQCHAEMGTDARVAEWIEGSEDYIAAAGTTAQDLRRDYEKLGPACAAAGAMMIEEWLRGLTTAEPFRIISRGRSDQL